MLLETELSNHRGAALGTHLCKLACLQHLEPKSQSPQIHCIHLSQSNLPISPAAGVEGRR